MKAIWNGQVIAESDQTEIVEGNYYFPRSAIKSEFFRESAHKTVCPWKGTASYYDLVSGDDESKNAAWYYPTTKPAANNIKDYIAFYPVVRVTS